jgi:glycosyltransferase involved in cell wall biosynthesis
MQLISIILPVYNTEKYLAESLESILAQTYNNFEIIAVNDGSTDRSIVILKSYQEKHPDKIRVVDLGKNGGIAAARNAGIRIACGRLIAFADSDDIWKPEKLQLQINQLENHPEISISFCMIQNFMSPDISDDIRATRYCPPDPMAGQISGTAVMKKEVFDTIGLLHETYRVGEFIDWMARATDAGFIQKMIPEVLYLRRVHATNTTSNRPALADYVKIMKAKLDRSRTAPKESDL